MNYLLISTVCSKQQRKRDVTARKRIHWISYGYTPYCEQLIIWRVYPTDSPAD